METLPLVCETFRWPARGHVAGQSPPSTALLLSPETTTSSSKLVSMRPRIPKKELSRGPPTPRSYTPSPGPKHGRTTSKLRVPPLIFLAHGNTLVQNHYLPRLPGQVGFAGDRPQDGLKRCAPLPDCHQNEENDGLTEDLENPFILHQEPDDPVMDLSQVSRHRRK
ncbi:hypothetical protein Hypma_003466 [Hypsizygus marmoreus]|uniref:Uncharacterized protein n=1 Tax=Hypsizygus marmoreus TaxID=39966 RepID=A0A369J6J3_HYPMA|nr:hypothetical protein Hypma_003466 [Hypsizygus marmoreus]